MLKWAPVATLAFFVPLLAGQWPTATNPQQPADDAAAQYPATQYPDASQSQNPSSQDAPDPADLQHGVARLSIVQGDVNIRRGDNNELTAAVVNAPLLTHDHLEAGGGSRAEVQLDSATMLRLAPGTGINFADLQYRRAQVQLAAGAVIFRVFPNFASQVEIDTPNVGVRALSPGEYRIAVFDDGTAEITVRSGLLQLMASTGSEQIAAGRTVLVRGDASGPMMQTQAEHPRDNFDSWSEDRDRGFAGAQSNQYVSVDMQGTADLDQYGNWVASGYGQVWRPQGVGSDWSPYSNGQWSYVDYYGWSWVDYSPWGWAPYHYGRWFWNTGVGWCWWPGGGIHRAYWSPALVGFFGFGGRVGFGFGGLGWVSLAPYERCNRWWGRSGWNGYGGGYRGFALASYHNSAIRGGAMTAAYNNFGGPHQRFSAATRTQISGGSTFMGRLPVEASRASFHYSDRKVVETTRFSSVQQRGFYHQSPSVRSFSATPNYRPNVSTPARTAGGWNSFGSPASGAGSSYGQHFQSQNQERSGWHDFGRPQNGVQQPRYNYQQAPRSYNQPSYQPRYNPGPSYRPSQPQPHFSAPPASHGSGGSSGSGSYHGGGSGSHSGGGGGHHGR